MVWHVRRHAAHGSCVCVVVSLARAPPSATHSCGLVDLSWHPWGSWSLRGPQRAALANRRLLSLGLVGLSVARMKQAVSLLRASLWGWQVVVLHYLGHYGGELWLLLEAWLCCAPTLLGFRSAYHVVNWFLVVIPGCGVCGCMAAFFDLSVASASLLELAMRHWRVAVLSKPPGLAL